MINKSDIFGDKVVTKLGILIRLSPCEMGQKLTKMSKILCNSKEYEDFITTSKNILETKNGDRAW